MGTSAGKIEAQLQQLESPLTNTALGYWCRLKERFKTQAVVVDDDERNRGPRCELVHCGLIKLITEGICCPLLDQLRRLREGWRRRKDRSRNIREAEAAQLMLPFGGEGELQSDVKSQGGTASPQQQRAGKRQVRKPRQRGLMRRIRRWEVQRRDTVKVAAPPQTPPIERKPSSCARRDETVIPRERLSPQVAQFLDSRSLRAILKTVDNLKTLVTEGGWERAAELTDEGIAKGAIWPVGWAVGVLRNQKRWGVRKHKPARARSGQNRVAQNLENLRIARERAEAKAASMVVS